VPELARELVILPRFKRDYRSARKGICGDRAYAALTRVVLLAHAGGLGLFQHSQAP